MKRLLIIALLTLPLMACGSSEDDPNLKPAKKSVDIVADYVETVVTAPGKARDAGALVEAQQNKTEDMLRQLEE
ncbi:MAG: hypothetical protein IME98_01040 [Proteobacteria bacterium]|nr:hypothetical protein [Pseudomonadota bacterium]